MLNLKKICKLILIAVFVCFVHSFIVPTQVFAEPASAPTTQKQDKKEEPTKAAGSNQAQSPGAVTGCSTDFGLFSGLINAGQTIFNGIRDLIYVVAGFGIIGVAVGGFFGNLNWKWLGAIVIALVVIASTGELLNVITGCKTYSSAVIQDTLR